MRFGLTWNISDPAFHDRVREAPFPSQAKRANRLFIFVHGFNTDGPSALANYAKFEALITKQKPRRKYGLVRLLWPSTPHGGGIATAKFARPAWYAPKVATALRAADHVGSELARSVVSGSAKTEIALIGHSLGCRLVLEAMLRWWTLKPWQSHALSVSTYLMAAAVDRQLLRQGEAFDLPKMSGPNHSVYYSGSDMVLWVTFPPGQTAALGDPRRRLFPTALGFKGVARDTTHTRNHRAHGFGHNTYWPEAEVVAKDIATDLVCPVGARREMKPVRAVRRDRAARALHRPRRAIGATATQNPA